MENLLLKYFGKDFPVSESAPVPCERPFITISREFGCPSKLIAEKLAKSLNSHSLHKTSPEWRFINKEVVLESARELELDPDKVKYFFDAEKRGTLDDILASFSSNYKSNIKILKTIRQVIRAFTSGGYVILVGRGGVAITYHCPRSLHIRLQAPLDWRVQAVAKHHDLSQEEAMRLTLETDKKRKAMIELFLNKKMDESLFDLIFNCSRMSQEEIVRSVVHVMEMKKMI